MQEFLEVPLLVRLLDLPPGQRILEVGCGRGIALPALANLCRPAHLTGLDIDGDLLNEAAAKLSAGHLQTELVQADVREMPFPDEFFDIVIDFGTCYHITHPERALKEIARVLSVGGAFVCETPVSQLLAHPVRSFWHTIPLGVNPFLVPHRKAVLWSSWVRR
jgi:ubiquinone/menaquinone biosynthesis C-methylase UbiE